MRAALLLQVSNGHHCRIYRLTWGQIPAHRTELPWFFLVTGKEPCSISSHPPSHSCSDHVYSVSSAFFFSPAAGITCIFSSPCTKKQWKGEEVASFWSTAVSLKLHRFQLCIEWLQSLMYLEWTSTHVCKGFVSLPDIAMRSKYSEFSSSKIHRFKGAE